jgi:hypothetical protein
LLLLPQNSFQLLGWWQGLLYNCQFWRKIGQIRQFHHLRFLGSGGRRILLLLIFPSPLAAGTSVRICQRGGCGGGTFPCPLPTL